MADYIQFNCASRPPESLSSVIQGIEANRSVKQQQFLPKDHLRGIALAANKRYYDPRGKTMALQKFLVETQVFLDDGKRFYFDPAQAAVVLKCCEDGTFPKDLPNFATRLAELKLQKAAFRMAKVAKLPDSAAFDALVAPIPPVDDAADVTTEVLEATEMDNLGQKADGDAKTPSDPEEKDAVSTSSVKVPLSDPAPASPAKVSVPLKRLLYTTPVEEDILITIFSLSKNVGLSDHRVAIPDDPEKFYQKYASRRLQGTCGPEEYLAALDRCIKSKLFHEIQGAFVKGKRTFALLVNYEEFLLVPIEKREAVFIEAEWMQIVRRLEKREDIVCDQSRGMTTRVTKIVQEWFPNMNDNAIRMRVFRGADETHKYAGIIVRQVESGRRLLCWAGFELHDLRVKAPVVLKPVSQPSLPKPFVVTVTERRIPVQTVRVKERVLVPPPPSRVHAPAPVRAIEKVLNATSGLLASETQTESVPFVDCSDVDLEMQLNDFRTQLESAEKKVVKVKEEIARVETEMKARKEKKRAEILVELDRVRREEAALKRQDEELVAKLAALD